jgi:hypothetical protein
LIHRILWLIDLTPLCVAAGDVPLHPLLDRSQEGLNFMWFAGALQLYCSVEPISHESGDREAPRQVLDLGSEADTLDPAMKNGCQLFISVGSIHRGMA